MLAKLATLNTHNSNWTGKQGRTPTYRRRVTSQTRQKYRLVRFLVIPCKVSTEVITDIIGRIQRTGRFSESVLDNQAYPYDW